MRFSSVFQLPAVPPQPAAPAAERVPVEQAAGTTAAATPAAPELPEDLDARVRLVGEWQLGEEG